MLHCYPRGWGKRETIPNVTLLTLHCYPRVLGKRETIPNATLLSLGVGEEGDYT